MPTGSGCPLEVQRSIPASRRKTSSASRSELRPYEAMSLLDAALWGLGLIPRLLVRLLWDIPRAALRVPGSDRWTIEAVSWYPHRTSRTWVTRGVARDEALAQIADAIRRGVVPRPAHATSEGHAEL